MAAAPPVRPGKPFRHESRQIPDLAAAAERKMRASHQSLFSGKQFVILAAEVKGKTTYRLRVAFNSSNDANGFCRNAKSDGLDCDVTK